MPASPAVQARYGRRAGWVRHHMALALDRVGAFASLRSVRWDAVERLVFVCQGNICRSAYAAGRARLRGLNAASCGLGARDGDGADATALARAGARGVDLSSHRAARLSPEMLRPSDLLLAMEPAHLKVLSRLQGVQVTLLGLWAAPQRPHLEDPYGLSPAYFDTCFDVIDSAVQNLARLAPRARTPR